MDNLFQDFGSTDGFNDVNNLKSSSSNQNPTDPSHPGYAASSSSSNSDGESPYSSETSDFGYAVLKYINDVLMEENLENRPCMLQDCLALQAAEKSFYDVLVQHYHLPSAPVHLHHSVDQNNELAQSSWTPITQDGFESYTMQNPNTNNSPEICPFVSRLYGEIEPFDPPNFNPPIEQEKEANKVENGLTGRRIHQREIGDCFEERRRRKHSALSVEVSDEPDMFDEVFLGTGGNNNEPLCPLYKASLKGADTDNGRQPKGSIGRKARGNKKQGNEKEAVDLWSLMIQCAQSVASGDQRSAIEQLNQIRQNSSPSGDGFERTAHYFANGLEARLAGSTTPLYTHIATNKTSSADIIKAYMLYVSACPFKRVSNIFANRRIAKQAAKAKTLHIIDFGISYGFQWPCLIHRLSTRPGGPPKIRITGIDLPQPGFRPAERVEATGGRLGRCCANVDVPFEYNAIANKWEKIQLEDLKLKRDELIVVNSMYRLRNLPDDTVAMSSPRDKVLELIKRINPELFIHGVVNGNYNVPFFVTRFREALYHFSTLFDIIDATVSREDGERTLVEREMFARDAMNVIACEGLERTDRPETYKQWQTRNRRAGFQQLPLDESILRRARSAVKSDYHKDFVIDTDGNWMLQGWKGRVVHALSCWKPLQD